MIVILDLPEWFPLRKRDDYIEHYTSHNTALIIDGLSRKTVTSKSSSNSFVIPGHRNSDSLPANKLRCQVHMFRGRPDAFPAVKLTAVNRGRL